MRYVVVRLHWLFAVAVALMLAACGHVFLRLNGISLDDPEHRLYDAIMDVARGDPEEYGLAWVFRTLVQDQPH